MPRRRRSRSRPRRGAATVEFAMTVPILFLLVFGAIEICRLNIMRHTAENAAYEGARRAIVPGATAAQAQQAASNILSIVGVSGADVAVSVTPAVIADETSEVTVTVEIPVGNHGWLVPTFTNGLTLRRSCTLLRERELASPAQF